MMRVPAGKRELISFSNDLIEQCRVSVGPRAAYCRLMNAIAETGRYDGTKSLINLLNKHLDRTAAHIFSPVELKFAIDFENTYPKAVLERANVVARILTRTWERSNTDNVFGRGVFEALKYGACLLKQWVQVEGVDETPVYYKKLVMPWQFGVYNESENEIDRQAVLCETATLTLPEVWRRIWHLPDAKKLFDRIKSHSTNGSSLSDPQSYFHQVLSTSQLNTGVQGMTRPVSGGIVQLNNDPNYAIMGPTIGAETVNVHELWVQDEDDWTTIIMVEPDIIIAPLYKRVNLLIPGSRLQPYRLIQPNEVTNWFWGRSELVDLIEPQALLSTWADDMKRLFGLQIDKILGFVGENNITDESYAQFRNAGYLNLGAGAKVEDLTPKLPPEGMAMLKFVIDIVNNLGGFPDIMRGQGDSGVRAGTHANTLLKTASPTLRDRSLLVERQCAMAADLTLSIKEAKDSNHYWTKADTMDDVNNTRFLLTDLPEDWRVTVDSHSSSPIFSDENSQLIFAGQKAGFVDGEYALDNLPYPNKEDAKARLREKEKRNAEMMQKIMAEHPEIEDALLKKQALGSARR